MLNMEDMQCCGNCIYFDREGALSIINCRNPKSKNFKNDLPAAVCDQWEFYYLENQDRRVNEYR